METSPGDSTNALVDASSRSESQQPCDGNPFNAGTVWITRRAAAEDSGGALDSSPPAFGRRGCGCFDRSSAFALEFHFPPSAQARARLCESSSAAGTEPVLHIGPVRTSKLSEAGRKAERRPRRPAAVSWARLRGSLRRCAAATAVIWKSSYYSATAL